MAADRGRTDDSVAGHLLTGGHDFGFFQAVRLLMRLMPGRRPVGVNSKPQEEVVRFGSRVSLEFPASQIHEIEGNPTGGGPPRMTVAFMGLMGTQGVLPFHYTEYMLQRKLAKDTAMEAFFNLFNHRWISLFYRAWEKHRLPIAYERTALEQSSSGRISHFLFDLIGLGTDGLRGRVKLPDETLIYFAGLITQRPRSAVNLQALLHAYFGVEVVVEQCRGAWYDLEPEDRCYLHGRSLRNQLGEGAVAGDKVWDQQSRFRIRVGPLNQQQFRSFLPGGKAQEQLSTLTRFFVGPTLAFEVQPVLKGPEVPWPRLGEAAAPPPQLGWNSWLRTGEMGRDPDDAVFFTTV
jgi:type VI secretion system protein ImpH